MSLRSRSIRVVNVLSVFAAVSEIRDESDVAVSDVTRLKAAVIVGFEESLLHEVRIERVDVVATEFEDQRAGLSLLPC